MEKNDHMKIIKIIVIIGIIIATISVVLPWRALSIDYNSIGFGSLGAEFYPWGGHYHADMSMSYMGILKYDVWSFFYSINTGAPNASSSTFSSDSTFIITSAQNSAVVAFLISFIMCIITLILGLFAMSRKNICLMTGITSLISIISFITGFTILLSIDTTGMIIQMIGYSFGFFLMIVAMIIFFLSYGLHILIPKMALSGVGTQTYSGYQPPPQTFEQNKNIYSPQPSSPIVKKICPKCGVSLNGDPEYCSNCSARLKW